MDLKDDMLLNIKAKLKLTLEKGMTDFDIVVDGIIK